MNFFLSFDVYALRMIYGICTVRTHLLVLVFYCTVALLYDIIKIHHYNTNNIRIIQYVLRKYYDIYDMS